MRPLGNETKFFVIFSFLLLKILVVFCSTRGNSTFHFFDIPGIANFEINRQINEREILGRILLSISFLELVLVC